LLRVSYVLDYFGFNKNLFGYAGASFLDASGNPIAPGAIGSDGLPTSASGNNPGTGGYFSPKNFVNDGGRVEVQGRANRSLGYRLSGFIGSQRYTGAQPHAAEGFSGTATLRLNDRFSLPLSYMWDNFGPFRQNTLLVRLTAKL
jgi:hypothetical protein